MNVDNVIAGKRVIGTFNGIVQGSFPHIRIKSPTLAHLKYLRDWEGLRQGRNYWFSSYKEIDVIDLTPLLTAKMCWYGWDINGTTAAVRGVLVDDIITTTTDKWEIDQWIELYVPVNLARSLAV